MLEDWRTKRVRFWRGLARRLKRWSDIADRKSQIIRMKPNVAWLVDRLNGHQPPASWVNMIEPRVSLGTDEYIGQPGWIVETSDYPIPHRLITKREIRQYLLN